MRTLSLAAAAILALLPFCASAGRDGADEMVAERARQRVIQQRAQMRAYHACLAAAKSDVQQAQCKRLLDEKI